MQVARERTEHTASTVAGPGPATRANPRRLIAGLSPAERALYALGAVTALAMAFTIYQIFLVAPVDVTGQAFRTFYFHVPIASICFLAFFVVFVASIMYLWRR